MPNRYVTMENSSKILDVDDADEPLTDREFARLRRYANGDLVDLDAHAPYLTDAQRDALTPADQDRLEDLESRAAPWLAYDADLTDVLTQFRAV